MSRISLGIATSGLLSATLSLAPPPARTLAQQPGGAATAASTPAAESAPAPAAESASASAAESSATLATETAPAPRLVPVASAELPPAPSAEPAAVLAAEAYRRGLRLLHEGVPRESAESFELALARGYRPPGEAYVGLGLAYRAVPLRKLQAVRAFRRALRTQPGSAEALYGYADTYLALDGWEGQREARRALLDLLRIDPLYRDAYSRWRALWPDRDEQVELAAALRRRLAAGFETEIAALAADLYLQGSEMDDLEDLLRSWRSAQASPPAAYHYHLARLLFARGELGEGTASWQAGLAAVRGRDDLAHYEEDLDPLLGEADRELREARTLGERVAFVRAFWAERDPLPFSHGNERLAEHYRRVEQVRRRYLWKKPLAKEKVVGAYVDDLGRPSFDTKVEGRSVDDRGTIFLRHGEPEWRNVELGGGEYWRYERPGLPGGKLQFHFKLMEGPMGRGNDSVYSITPTTEIGEANVRRGHAGSEGVANTRLGLGADSYAHDYGPAILPVAAAAATFRSRESPARTDLLLAVGVPLDRVLALEGDRAELGLRLKLYDREYREELELADTMRLSGAEGGRGSLVGAFAIGSYPGERRYAVQVDGLARGSIGLQRGAMTFPSYAGRHLQLSDVLLARAVAPAAADPGAPAREGHAIRPLLGSGLDRSRPLHLYYEVYDLPAGQDGRARYQVEYRVAAETPLRPGLLARVFGSGGSAGPEEGEVALSFRKERPEAVERFAETISLDLSVLPTGRYRVTVSVSEPGTGAEASRVVVLDLRGVSEPEDPRP